MGCLNDDSEELTMMVMMIMMIMMRTRERVKLFVFVYNE